MANKKPVSKSDGEKDMYGKGMNEPKAKGKTKSAAKGKIQKAILPKKKAKSGK